MIKLLKNANVYAPEKLGKKDILIEGEKILLMQDLSKAMRDSRGWRLMTWREKSLFRLTLTCMCISPAAVESRDRHPVCRESQLSEFFKNGITTVVGLLGTDGVTRSVENLVAKARA